jgi:wyosine [tRNA(Phe)-imidazoG37] synthetase (radical SAM superfamily)
MDISFGPVPSRRLGLGLGINHIPRKHCSYSCVYCRLGPTQAREITPRPFHPVQRIRRQVVQRLEAVYARGEVVDCLTFAPEGESTLDSRLGEAIDSLRDLELPIAVVSNASLIGRQEVRAILNRADWVSLKVDSVDQSIWRRINRPHPNLRLPDILDGIQTFARDFAGTLVSETMLLAGINDSPASIEALGRFLDEAGIRRAYLAIPHCALAMSSLHAPDEAVMTHACRRMTANGMQVELLTGFEEQDSAFSGDFRRDLLAITAVKPLCESAVRALADKARVDLSVVARLLDSGELRRVVHEGEPFYIRRIHRESASTTQVRQRPTSAQLK